MKNRPSRPHSRNRIWFVSELFYPVFASTGYYITEIARHVAESGFDVGVLSTLGVYRDLDAKTAPAHEIYEKMEIFRVRGGGASGKGIARGLSALHTSLRLFRAMLSLVHREDRIVAVTNPPLIIPFLFLLRKLRGVEYVVIVHDLFPENLPVTGVLRRRGHIFTFLRSMYYFFYSQAAMVICIGRDVRNMFTANLGSVRPEVVVIPNWADDTNVWPIPKYECRMIQELGISGKIVLQFAGNLGLVQNIEIILKMAAECRNNLLHFLFVGTGAKKELVEKHIEANPNCNVTYLEYMDRDRQNDFLNSCDIGLVTLSDGMYGLGVPSKSYNIMAAGRPILYIGDEGSEIYVMVRENDIGWAFRSDQYREIMSLLDSLPLQSSEIERKGRNARRLAETVYSKSRILRLYVQAIASPQ
jgi:glycosyltransferase involved in cell wall biosynthesis